MKWKAQQQSISRIHCYQAYGTLSFVLNDKKVYTRFIWKKDKSNHYYLILLNFLGGTEISLNVQPGKAQLLNQQGKFYLGKDPDILIQHVFGKPVPFGNLCQWMIGLPGDSKNFCLNDFGCLYQVNCSYNKEFWKIVYKKYYTDMIPSLPSCLEIHCLNDLITLNINRWNVQ